ncbi:ABC transporter ATP-binding protein [Bacillus sonorensis]|nr:ABC transporter ATP-binding protein [Bacillus sonorensis]
MSVIDLQNICLKQGDFSFSSVSLSVPKGKITGIIGPNGSGKSTLVKIIAKLIQPREGTVYIHDGLLTAMSRKELAREIAVLMQSKERVPQMTVQELVTYGRTPHRPFYKGLSPVIMKLFIGQWMSPELRKMQTEWCIHYRGRKAKVYIAMALAQKTKTLILDEPTTFLDIAHQLDVMELLKELNEIHDLTVLMVLHDLQQAAKYCDYLIAMKGGDVFQTGAPNEVMNEFFFRSYTA